VRSDRRPGPGLGPDPDADLPPDLPPPGERAALARLDEFVERHLAGYADARDAPGRDATSRLSPYLHFGCVHPRTVLARSLRAGGRSDLGTGAETFRKELAWREFYADVLFATPSSARHDLTPSARAMSYEEPGEEFEAWKAGRTGFPIVDAGMRQLRAEGWMHNRVRMIVASFLCKDLHVHWWHGARYFMARLVDGDLASNNHGWQWVAGTGADAAPYFRVFNPVAQGEKFDPDGTYIRRYVPELAELSGREIHEPWKRSGGPPGGYPLPIVDHAEQRREALARYQHARESP
jgi:deoxyribodipyrimidine photo-lyase